MSKRILYKNSCTPLEQISVGGEYYLDSSCRKTLRGSILLDLGAGTIVGGSLSASAGLGGPNIDFIAVSVEKLNAGEVYLSLDNNASVPIALFEGAAFVSQIAPTAEPYVRMSGTFNPGDIKVNYIRGVIA